ncbi:MAG: type II toxin-antitoxin system VapC family toxin [Ilumatobacteraceae bacterium]
MTDTVVVDASAMVDLLLGSERSEPIRASLNGRSLVAPAHMDVEVMSAIGRLQRSNDLTPQGARSRLERLVTAPIERVPVAPLLLGAWARCDNSRLADALYIELAAELDTVVVTSDLRLAREHPTRTLAPGGRDE